MGTADINACQKLRKLPESVYPGSWTVSYERIPQLKTGCGSLHPRHVNRGVRESSLYYCRLAIKLVRRPATSADQLRPTLASSCFGDM